MTINSLRLKRDIVSMEAFSLPNVTDLVKRIIPGMILDMKSYIGTLSFTDSAINLTSNQKSLIKELPKHTYNDLSHLIVFVPEGLDVNYKQYLEALKLSLNQTDLVIEELGNYTTFLSRLVTNSDDLISTDYAKNKYKAIQEELEHASDVTSKCFKKNSTDTEKKYSNIVRNNSELKEVVEEMNTLITRIEAVDKKVITKKVNEASELLTIIYNKIKRGDMDNISPEMVSKISDYTYIIAKYLEFYSVTYYRVKAFTSAVNQTIDKVNEIINR